MFAGNGLLVGQKVFSLSTLRTYINIRLVFKNLKKDVRFSDFLRTYSASAAAEAAAATAWRHCEALVGGLGRFFLVQVVTSLSLAEHALTGRRYLFCRSTIALFQ